MGTGPQFKMLQTQKTGLASGMLEWHVACCDSVALSDPQTHVTREMPSINFCQKLKLSQDDTVSFSHTEALQDHITLHPSVQPGSSQSRTRFTLFMPQ